MAVSIDIYSAQEYLQEAGKRIDNSTAASRILLMAMQYSNQSPEISSLSDSLVHAAGRGAETLLSLDAMSFMHDDLDGPRMGPLWYSRDLPDSLSTTYAPKKQLLDTLNELPDTKARIINRPERTYSLHVAGRSHIKLGIFDDYVGVSCANFDHPEYFNMAVGFEDQMAADWLYGLVERAMDDGNVARSLEYTDVSYRIDDHTELLVDAGVRNQSVIYDGALALIDSAKDWLTITCQFFPSGETADHLLAAHNRGVEVEIIYSPASAHKLFTKIGGNVVVALERLRLPKTFFSGQLAPDQPKMHTKLIACDAGSMVGSHNYVTSGVRLGTAEIALRSTDPALAVRLRQAAHDQSSK